MTIKPEKFEPFVGCISEVQEIPACREYEEPALRLALAARCVSIASVDEYGKTISHISFSRHQWRKLAPILHAMFEPYEDWRKES